MANQITSHPPMSKGEREDLQRLVRQREKVLKSHAKQRSAELLADFENQMGSRYSFDQDEVWQQAYKIAEAEARKSETIVAERCRDLGISDQFAPSLSLHWQHNGYDNALEKRRKELRIMAQTRIHAIERKAIVQIETSCLDAQTQIAIAGLTSDRAKQFIATLPSIEILRPNLSFAEISGETDPPLRNS